jgi:hypothetical protein
MGTKIPTTGIPVVHYNLVRHGYPLVCLGVGGGLATYTSVAHIGPSAPVLLGLAVTHHYHRAPLLAILSLGIFVVLLILLMPLCKIYMVNHPNRLYLIPTTLV